MSMDKLWAWHKAAVDKAKGPVKDGLVRHWAKNMEYLKLVYGPYNGNAITWAVAMLEEQAATITRLEQELARLKSPVGDGPLAQQLRIMADCAQTSPDGWAYLNEQGRECVRNAAATITRL